MLIDHQLPRDIRDIKVQMAELITQELEGVVRRAERACRSKRPARATSRATAQLPPGDVR
jgi:hypothetical protein